MDSIQQTRKRTIFDQAGPDPKRISKLDQQLFSLSPPISLDKSPAVPLRSISGNSLPDGSSIQEGANANQEEARGVYTEDSALSLDFGHPASLGHETNHLVDVSLSLRSPTRHEGNGRESVSPPEFSQPTAQNGVRWNNSPSKPVQEYLFASEASKPGKEDKGISSPSQVHDNHSPVAHARVVTQPDGLPFTSAPCKQHLARAPTTPTCFKPKTSLSPLRSDVLFRDKASESVISTNIQLAEHLANQQNNMAITQDPNPPPEPLTDAAKVVGDSMATQQQEKHVAKKQKLTSEENHPQQVPLPNLHKAAIDNLFSTIQSIQQTQPTGTQGTPHDSQQPQTQHSQGVEKTPEVSQPQIHPATRQASIDLFLQPQATQTQLPQIENPHPHPQAQTHPQSSPIPLNVSQIPQNLYFLDTEPAMSTDKDFASLHYTNRTDAPARALKALESRFLSNKPLASANLPHLIPTTFVDPFKNPMHTQKKFLAQRAQSAEYAERYGEEPPEGTFRRYDGMGDLIEVPKTQEEINTAYHVAKARVLTTLSDTLELQELEFRHRIPCVQCARPTRGDVRDAMFTAADSAESDDDEDWKKFIHWEGDGTLEAEDKEEIDIDALME